MTVYLMGAGPGDPDLLTLKADRILRRADVVVYDRLVGPEILDRIAPWAERVHVGKDPNGVSVSQTEIHEILIDRGLRSETVVRLKGGDPFVFGRGGEEAVALAAHNIGVEVIPGISSAIAGPAAAGIPVTNRHQSSAFTVVTAHQDPGAGTALDWNALARLGSTLVVLMGASRALLIRDRLIAGGMDAKTPVAIVINATTTQQETRRLALGQLGVDPVPNPAVMVIGAVAAASVIDPIELIEDRTLEGATTW